MGFDHLELFNKYSVSMHKTKQIYKKIDYKQVYMYNYAYNKMRGGFDYEDI